MLSKDTLEFIKALTQNNDRDWFAANKEWYERSRADMEQLVSQLINAVSEFEPRMKYLGPKKCLFRIYRDTRFSNDKSPYKTNFGAILRPADISKGSGYYLHVSPEESFLSCGHYMLPPSELKKMRKGIYDDFETLHNILNEKDFKEEFEGFSRDEDILQRVPNGFDKNHPAAEYMKLKHFYVLKPISESQLLKEDFVSYAAGIYKKMQPLSNFLNDILMD